MHAKQVRVNACKMQMSLSRFTRPCPTRGRPRNRYLSVMQNMMARVVEATDVTCTILTCSNTKQLRLVFTEKHIDKILGLNAAILSYAKNKIKTKNATDPKKKLFPRLRNNNIPHKNNQNSAQMFFLKDSDGWPQNCCVPL